MIEMYIAFYGRRIIVEKDVLTVISNQKAHYSKGQRQIAKYILEN
jgi:hypothetical protein